MVAADLKQIGHVFDRRFLHRMAAVNVENDMALRSRVDHAHYLLSLGQAEAARRAIDRIEEVTAGRSQTVAIVAKFRAQHRALVELEIEPRITRLGRLGDALLDPAQPVFVPTPKARGLLVVFATLFNNIELSLPVLHLFLAGRGVAILYLRDPTRRLFLRGIHKEMPSFEAMLREIHGLSGQAAPGQLAVLGDSSSGYGSLLAAHRLKARRYLGFSIRADLSRGSPLEAGPLLTEALRDAIGEERLVDLKPLVETGAPGAVRLVYGARSPVDRLHALHLADLPTVTADAVADCHHSVVMDLLGRGRLAPLLAGLLRDE